MANKKQALEGKLGSWTDQADLTRNSQPVPDPAPKTPPGKATRETYVVARSLIDRIADTATTYDMTQNELVGYLLTWALDQVDTGQHDLRRGKLQDLTASP